MEFMHLCLSGGLARQTHQRPQPGQSGYKPISDDQREGEDFVPGENSWGGAASCAPLWPSREYRTKAKACQNQSLELQLPLASCEERVSAQWGGTLHCRAETL